MGSRPPDGNQAFIFPLVKFGFGKSFGASSWSNHWAGYHQLLYKVHLSSHSTIWSRNVSLLLYRIEDNTSKQQLMRQPFIKLFHPSNLLQMSNDHRKIDVQFFSNFPCNSKRISFDDCSQMVIISFWWLTTMLFIFKAHLLGKTSWTTTALYVR